jgi:hypothetical protein
MAGYAIGRTVEWAKAMALPFILRKPLVRRAHAPLRDLLRSAWARAR